MDTETLLKVEASFRFIAEMDVSDRAMILAHNIADLIGDLIAEIKGE